MSKRTDNAVGESAERVMSPDEVAEYHRKMNVSRIRDASVRLGNRGIAFEDVRDFLEREKPQPQWIVKDLIAKGMKGDLCGKSKSKKTFAALQFALCVAAGRNFLGACKVEGRHKVAYVNLELLEWNLDERISDMSESLGIGTDADGFLKVCNLRAAPGALRGDEPECFECEHLDSCGRQRAERCKLKREAKALDDLCLALEGEGIELVIIDPRYKLLRPGEDENTVSGLRGVLMLRDRLMEQCAVMIVVHDPKGGTEDKAIGDRGAGSYAGGADYDFRIAIDPAEGHDADNQVYAARFDARARPAPTPVGVRFTNGAFVADDEVSTEIQTRKGMKAKRDSCESARDAADKQRRFKEAALDLVGNQPPGSLLTVTEFSLKIATYDSVRGGVNDRDKMRNALIDEGVLATTLERDPDSKTGLKRRGRKFISTPERINAYISHCEKLRSTRDA